MTMCEDGWSCISLLVYVFWFDVSTGLIFMFCMLHPRPCWVYYGLWFM